MPIDLKRVARFSFIVSWFKKISSLLSRRESVNTDNKIRVPDKKPKTISAWKQIKYLPKFLSTREKLIIRAAIIVIILCLVLTGYLFLADNLATKPAQGGVYTENLVGTPQYINPLYASVNEVDRDLVRLTFAGLVKFDQRQNIVPDLAEEWFINEAKTTYTFKLRDNVYWPDGKKFTSEDVLFTFGAILNKDYGSPLRANWSGIEITAPNELTVQFILPEPFNPFLSSLTTGILPAHLWSEILPENALLAELNLKPVGLGPYRFKALAKDKQGHIKSYTLTRNEKYYGQAPNIDQIICKFYPTFEMAVDSLKNKNADGISFLPQNLKERLINRKDLNYYSLSSPQYTAIFFNQEKNTLLKDKRIREALSISIDKEKIIAEVLGGEASVIQGPILPGFAGYDEKMATSTLDIARAKELLTEAGWKKKKIEKVNNNDEDNKQKNKNNKGNNNETATTTDEALPEIDNTGMSKYLFKADKELTINLTISNQPQSIAVAKLIQKYWQAIGVKVNLDIVEGNQIQNEVIAPRKFEALLFGEILGADPDPYAFWHSTQAGENGLNLANFKNAEADKLLEKARKESEIAKRAKSYQLFQKILIKEIPAIFLYSPNYTYVVAKKIKGINLQRIISPADRLNGIDKWYIKTRKGFK